ncbi:MAG: hypothetical protein R3B90_11920 [Planctomycetaceae bacterium]
MKKPALFTMGENSWWQRVREIVRPHKTVLALAAGVAVGWGAFYFTAIRPLTSELRKVRGEMTVMAERMEQVVGTGDTARGGRDLLSAMEAQRSSLENARASLAALRMLRGEIEQESLRASGSREALRQMTMLQEELLTATGRTAELESTVGSFEQLSARIDALRAPVAESLVDVERAGTAVAELSGLKAGVLAAHTDLPQAREAVAAWEDLNVALMEGGEKTLAAREQADSLLTLASTLEQVPADQLDDAQQHATRLLAVHDMLADSGELRLDEAKRNLQSLLGTHVTLLETTPELVDAAENLDLLVRFQQELSRELQELESMRHKLTEVALLRDTFTRMTVALEPLVAMTSLERLDAEQVREVARQILNQRTAQLPRADVLSKPAVEIGGSTPVEPRGVDILVPQPADPE